MAIACHLEHLCRSAIEHLDDAKDSPEQAKRRVVDFYRACQTRRDRLAPSTCGLGAGAADRAAHQVETIALDEFLGFVKQFHGVS